MIAGCLSCLEVLRVKIHDDVSEEGSITRSARQQPHLTSI